MNTRAEIVAAVKQELQLVTTSTFVDTTNLNLLVWDAYVWCAGKYPWPQLSRAYTTVSTVTSTVVDYYYDYPGQVKTNGVFRVYVDGEEYDPKSFEDFLDYRRKYAADQSRKIFATYARQYFIHPTPTAAGVEILVWGLIQPEIWTADADKSIFSDSDAHLNEAIKCKTISYLTKGNEQQTYEQKATTILASGYKQINARTQRFQKLDNPMFNVPDYYARNGTTTTGTFSN